jgi:sulfite reductase (ferredoxin)
LADPICTIGPSPEELLEICTAIVSIHRDFGNRTNRKVARLKYVLDNWGVEKFKAELEARVGRPLPPPRELVWRRANDYLGWHSQGDGRWFVGVRIVSGRVKDFDVRHRIRSGLRSIVERYGLQVRLTCQQNLYLSNIAPEDKPAISEELRRCGLLPHEELPPVLRHAIACPALPTCGQAITESERILPALVKEIQAELNDVGLARDVVHVRTSGCPNGCSRPYTAEIGIVGASVDLYTIYLGASPLGTRLGQMFAQNVRRSEIPERLRPILQHYSEERFPHETFGDFCHRMGMEALRTLRTEVAA